MGRVLTLTKKQEREVQKQGLNSMIAQLHPVSVKQLPEKLDDQSVRCFLREISGCVDVNRPRIVLDCSAIREVDGATIELLLHTLEEAMKRNGDVRLASLPEAGAALLELTGVSRLFEIFANSADAVNSFHQLPASAEMPVLVAESSSRASEHAA